ncbi:LytR/AlgR family response regulator transcription factor [Kineothrix sp. MB12-C1]|uniref:LytR/AlgR family response regulator transcription factor n=1 Tax=Kineothrix sp. MB12-C1 TaxID=3070215 RepID=UPI0027D253B1|nr:LytTR family DNA-binding domain-containing protein [Kineothrix sp. MB12-C1]WMC93055.1 LytTR family DNA-binding domain-containing protein [Kineothrix sp. MB12-C1]
MVYVAICDSNMSELRQLKLAVQGIMDKLLIPYNIEEYDSGEKLVRASRIFDLVFLDIRIDGENGIEIGRLIYEKNSYTKIIFQSSFKWYCQEALNRSHAFAFLEKPIQTDLLEEQIKESIASEDKIQRLHIEFKNVKYISGEIEVKKELLVLPVEEIVYFQYIKTQKKIEIVTNNQKYIYSETMKELEERMKPLGFETNCRGFLINVGKVSKITRYRIQMDNGEELPLSQKRVVGFKERVNEFIYNSC